MGDLPLFYRRFDVSYNPDSEVMVTVGGSEAIDIALRAMCDPGDEVLIPQPSYGRAMYHAGGWKASCH